MAPAIDPPMRGESLTAWREKFDRATMHMDPLDAKELLHRLTAKGRKRPPIPGALRTTVYRRDGHACLRCGASERLSLDHVVPYSKGGQDTAENLQTLCLSCNCRKGASV